jgi:hypothetical protein
MAPSSIAIKLTPITTTRCGPIITEMVFPGGKTIKKVFIHTNGIESSHEVTTYDPLLGGGCYTQQVHVYNFSGFKFREVDTYEPDAR